MNYYDKRCQRQVILYTPQKTYSGVVDLGSMNMRTIDLFNSANIYWKKPSEKSLNDSIMLKKVHVTIGGGTSLGSFSTLQMRLSEIIFFTDEREEVGDFGEKSRATSLANKNGNGIVTARIITRMSGDVFYVVNGILRGLFRAKSKNRYLPIVKATVNAVARVGDTWKNETVLSNAFIGLATDHIEACSVFQGHVGYSLQGN